MSVCQYCGQSAGLFSHVHKECEKSAQEGIVQYTDAVKQAVLKGSSYQEASTPLTIITMGHKMLPDQIKAALMDGWSQAVNQLMDAGPISDAIHTASTKFLQDAGIDSAALATTQSSINLELNFLFWCVTQGKLAQCPPVAGNAFTLQPGETAILMLNNISYARDVTSKRTVRHTSSSGTGIHDDGFGVGFHSSNSVSQVVENTEMTKVDDGQVLFTTRNMYFGGQHKSFRLPYTDLLDVKSYSNGLGFFRDKDDAPAEVLCISPGWSGPSPKFWCNLVHFLASSDAQALYGVSSHKAAGK
jgi:hypothetical protein